MENSTMIFFNRWEDFHKATFNPDCEIKVVKEIK